MTFATLTNERSVDLVVMLPIMCLRTTCHSVTRERESERESEGGREEEEGDDHVDGIVNRTLVKYLKDSGTMLSALREMAPNTTRTGSSKKFVINYMYYIQCTYT